MTTMLNYLARTNVLVMSFIAFLLIGAAFMPVEGWTGGVPLDMIQSGDAAMARLAGMTAEQKQAHVWVTALLDSAYPLAYGAFLAGFAARFSPPSWRPWIAWPALATVIADFAENGFQIAALTGNPDLLAVKSVLTPLKFGLFLLAASIVIGLIALVIARRLFRR